MFANAIVWCVATDKRYYEKLEDVAGFLQGWLAFKKSVPPDEVIKLHFDLVMEVLAKKNEVLDPVICCQANCNYEQISNNVMYCEKHGRATRIGCL